MTLDCEDESLNRFLVATARAYGVPVNILDNRELSEFYLGAIVDRALLIIANGMWLPIKCIIWGGAVLPMPRSNWRTTRFGNRRIRRSTIISNICRTARGRGANNQLSERRFCRHRDRWFWAFCQRKFSTGFSPDFFTNFSQIFWSVT